MCWFSCLWKSWVNSSPVKTHLLRNGHYSHWPEPLAEEPQLEQMVLKVPLALEMIVLYLTSKCFRILDTSQGKLESPVVSTRKLWGNRMKWRHFIVHIDFCKIGGSRLGRSHYGEAVCRGAQGPHFGLCHWKHTFAGSFLCGSVTTSPDVAPCPVAAGLALESSTLLPSALRVLVSRSFSLFTAIQLNQPSQVCIFILLILGRIYLQVSALCLIL